MNSSDPQPPFQDAESASKAFRSVSGIQEWELALAPLAGTGTVLTATAQEDSLEIQIGRRVNKTITLLYVLSLILVFWTGWIRLYDDGLQLTIGNFDTILWAFICLTALRQEWVASRPERLMLTPETWRLERAGKVVSEGTRPPQVIFEASAVKLRDVDQVSVSFGRSLNPEEKAALQDIVASHSRPHLPEPAPRAKDESQALTVRVTDLKVPTERPSVLRLFSSVSQTFRVLPPKLEARFLKSSESDLALFERHGFKRAGFIKHATLWIFGSAKEVFLSADGTIALHRSTSDAGFFGSLDPNHYMATLMSDGRYRLTGSTLPSEGLVYSVPSTGDFEKDFESHQEWIADEYNVHKSLPVQMTSIEDRVATLKYYARYREAKSTSLTVLALVALAFSSVAILVVFFVGIIL